MRVLLRVTTDPSGPGSADRPIDFHRRLPGYRESRLVEAPRLAKWRRQGLRQGRDLPDRPAVVQGAGASWATYAALRERIGPVADGPLSYEGLQAWASPPRPLTLIAATDGNHGHAVARVARWFGLRSRIFIPNFVSPGRRQAIEAEGAELVSSTACTMRRPMPRSPPRKVPARC